MTSVVKSQRLLFVFSFLVLFSCTSKKEKNFTQVKGNAQGTTFNVVYEDTKEEDYSLQIDSLFRLIDNSMSLWDSTSVITALNKSTNGCVVDSHFKNVFLLSKSIASRTHESFDISVGSLIKSWGFIRKNGLPIPSDEEIQRKMAFVGQHNFSFVGDSLIKKIPEAEIDMNAVAQGYTVDVLANFLEEKGVLNFLIEVGGEIRTKGKNQYGDAWKVGIEKPDFNAGISKNSIKAVIGLSDRALATSGSYRKFIEVDGKKYSHTIDPKTGRPVSHNLLSVTVLAQDCASADAFATAFMVLGQDSAMAIASREKLDIYCIYDEQGELKSIFTPGFEKLLIHQN
jgi:FAD:protein FMN transferase